MHLLRQIVYLRDAQSTKALEAHPHYSHHTQMVAYMFFTPCFREGKVIGYQANILRRDPKIAKCVHTSLKCVYMCRVYVCICICMDHPPPVSLDPLVPYMKIHAHTNAAATAPTKNRPTYALDFLLLHCYITFKKEGLAFLSLSIAPLYGIGKDETDSRMLRAAFR